jgi:hypothetical protein
MSTSLGIVSPTEIAASVYFLAATGFANAFTLAGVRSDFAVVLGDRFIEVHTLTRLRAFVGVAYFAVRTREGL